MAQLSRPYQIGLAAVALLAAAWLLLFQGHSGSPSSSSSAQAPAAPAHTTSAPSATASTQGTAGQATGHGSASSLGALGHSIEKARGAVATSQKNAQELEAKSAQASSPTAANPPASNSSPSTSPSTSSSTHATSPTHAAGAAGAAGAATQTKTATPSTATHAAPKTAPSTRGAVRAKVAFRQHLVEAQLAQGKTALIFFWNPKGSDDKAVNRALQSLPQNLHIAIDRAGANAVTTFGTITRGVQVYGTPTLLVVNKKGEVTTLTGLQDTYTIANAIREARR
jgi:hypothetical protein